MKFVIPALVFVLTGVSFYGLLAIAGLVPYLTFSGNAVAVFVIELAQVFIPILIFIFLVLKALADIPPELDNKRVDQINEQETQVKELQNTWEGEAAKSNLRVTESNEPFFNNKAGIEIFNEYYKQVVTIHSIKMEHLNLKIPEEQSYDSLLSPIGREFCQQPIIIQPRHSQIVVLAEGTFDQVKFLSREEYGINRKKREKHNGDEIGYAQLAIELSVRGVIDDGRSIQTETVRAKIGWTAFYSHRYYDRVEQGFKRADPPQPLSSIQIYEVTHGQEKETDPKSNSAQ